MEPVCKSADRTAVSAMLAARGKTEGGGEPTVTHYATSERDAGSEEEEEWRATPRPVAGHVSGARPIPEEGYAAPIVMHPRAYPYYEAEPGVRIKCFGRFYDHPGPNGDVRISMGSDCRKVAFTASEATVRSWFGAFPLGLRINGSTYTALSSLFSPRDEEVTISGVDKVERMSWNSLDSTSNAYLCVAKYNSSCGGGLRLFARCVRTRIIGGTWCIEMQILENRVAIVTGGTGALGRAVVENFLIAGAKAAVPYVVDAEVPLLQKQLGDRFRASEIFLKRADVTDEAQTAKFVTDVASKWDKIDILVNPSADSGAANRSPKPRSRNGGRCSIST